MLNTFLVALATFFATVGVADIAFLFAALTKDNTPAERRRFATHGVLIAAGILLFFAFLGNQILAVFGITLPSLRTAGGILLLLIGIDMVFARHSGGTQTTSEEHAEARKRQDISVFPLAMPLMAGPGTISAVILLTTGAKTMSGFWAVIGALMLIMGLTWLLLLVALPIQRMLGLTGLSVVSRIAGILLAALAVQFVFEGIASSGLLQGALVSAGQG